MTGFVCMVALGIRNSSPSALVGGGASQIGGRTGYGSRREDWMCFACPQGRAITITSVQYAACSGGPFAFLGVQFDSDYPGEDGASPFFFSQVSHWIDQYRWSEDTTND